MTTRADSVCRWCQGSGKCWICHQPGPVIMSVACIHMTDPTAPDVCTACGGTGRE